MKTSQVTYVIYKYKLHSLCILFSFVTSCGGFIIL